MIDLIQVESEDFYSLIERLHRLLLLLCVIEAALESRKVQLTCRKETHGSKVF